MEDFDRPGGKIYFLKDRSINWGRSVNAHRQLINAHHQLNNQLIKAHHQLISQLINAHHQLVGGAPLTRTGWAARQRQMAEGLKVRWNSTVAPL